MNHKRQYILSMFLIVFVCLMGTVSVEAKCLPWFHKYKMIKYIAPMCYYEGEKTEKCTRCNYVRTTKIPKNINKHPSGAQSWIRMKEPTCKQEGEKRRYCWKCWKVVKTKKIKALGHKMVKWGRPNSNIKKRHGKNAAWYRFCSRGDCYYHEVAIPCKTSKTGYKIYHSRYDGCKLGSKPM